MTTGDDDVATGDDDPREVLRSFLERLDESPTDLASGPLETLIRHTAEVDSGGYVLSTTLEWHDAVTTERTDTEVEVDFRAARTSLLRTSLGDVTKTEWYSGPARVRRAGNAWKVLDLKRNGISLVEQIRVPRHVDTFGDAASVQPVVFLDAPDVFRAILFVHNDSDEDFWAHEIALRHPRRFTRLAALAPELDLEPNERRTVRVAWPQRRQQLTAATISLPVFCLRSRRWYIAGARGEVTKPEQLP